MTVRLFQSKRQFTNEVIEPRYEVLEWEVFPPSRPGQRGELPQTIATGAWIPRLGYAIPRLRTYRSTMIVAELKTDAELGKRAQVTASAPWLADL